jgi:Domain of unknown function (DUF397)
MIWRKSTYSAANGDCVEVAERNDVVLLRNSNRPEAGTLTLDRSAVAAFIAECAAGELDEMTSLP